MRPRGGSASRRAGCPFATLSSVSVGALTPTLCAASWRLRLPRAVVAHAGTDARASRAGHEHQRFDRAEGEPAPRATSARADRSPRRSACLGRVDRAAAGRSAGAIRAATPRASTASDDRRVRMSSVSTGLATSTARWSTGTALLAAAGARPLGAEFARSGRASRRRSRGPTSCASRSANARSPGRRHRGRSGHRARGAGAACERAGGACAALAAGSPWSRRRASPVQGGGVRHAPIVGPSASRSRRESGAVAQRFRKDASPTAARDGEVRASGRL